MSRRIAVLGVGSNSHTNARVVQSVRDAFPEYEVEWFDLAVEAKRATHGLVDVLSAIHAAREFSEDIGLHVEQLRWRRGWTTYLFNLRSELGRDCIRRGEYAFTFQIQSHFDASVDGIPHFVYTDHCVLANHLFPHRASAGVLIAVKPEWLRLERSLYHHARTTFVMSRHVQRVLTDEYGCDPKRVVCAFGGPNAPVVRPASKSYDTKTILFVGVNWVRKGGPQLRAAFDHVRGRIPRARLTIVGCSPKLRIEGCEVLGRLPPAQLARHYQNATVFCMPTLYEPFGIVYLEAMAYGLPIVATDVGALPDFVHNGINGFRVPSGDVDALANALIALLDDPATCARMGSRSVEIAQEYTWERTGRIFRETIEAHLDRARVAL